MAIYTRYSLNTVVWAGWSYPSLQFFIRPGWKFFRAGWRIQPRNHLEITRKLLGSWSVIRKLLGRRFWAVETCFEILDRLWSPLFTNVSTCVKSVNTIRKNTLQSSSEVAYWKRWCLLKPVKVFIWGDYYLEVALFSECSKSASIGTIVIKMEKVKLITIQLA